MSNETTTTVAGNLTADPELRFTGSGVTVARFTVASTSRVQVSASGEWRDGDTLFLRCTVWRRMAENVVESLLIRSSKLDHGSDQRVCVVDMSWTLAGVAA